MSEKITMDVAVHKAALPLATGESLKQYTAALSDAARKHLKQSMKLTEKDSCYAAEVYGDKAVFDIWKSPDAKYVYMAVKYTRDKDGIFSFSDAVEVKPITVFQAADTFSIAKNAEANVEKAWTAAEVNDFPDTAFAVILPGGMKDKSGKTVPRSLRALPHHNATVTNPKDDKSVDLPHLRNALARVNQLDADQKYKTQASTHLEAHAKKLLASHGAEVKKALWANVL
jgi:hypothetical protein